MPPPKSNLQITEEMELNFQAADLVLLKRSDMDGGLGWSPGGPFVAHCVFSRLGPAVEDQS